MFKKNFSFFGEHNLLKNNPTSTKMSQDLFISFFFLKVELCDFKKDWMMPHDVFFLISLKTADISKNVTRKVFKLIIFENNNIIAFWWRIIQLNRTSGLEIRAIQVLETKKLMSASYFSHTQQTIPRQGNFVKSLKNL